MVCPFPGEEGLLRAISGYLNRVYQEHYLVFNLSEYKYDNEAFMNQVRRT